MSPCEETHSLERSHRFVFQLERLLTLLDFDLGASWKIQGILMDFREYS